MKTKMCVTGLAVLLLLGVGGSVGSAEVAATIVGEFATDYPTGNGVGYCRGWRFWADEEITITHLGVLDWGDPGLKGSHKVGLWQLNDPDPGATLLRSVDISGTDGTLSEGYRYVEMVDSGNNPYPITLPADPLHEQPRYLIGVWTESDDQNDPDGMIIRPTDAVTVTSAITIENQLGRYTGVFDFPWSPTSEFDHFAVNFSMGALPSPGITVDIDIKPGSYPNSINLGSNGVVPVAILSSADFDATDVDPETVLLAGAGVAVRGKGNKYLASQEDVNGDGLLDLSLKVETENLDPGQFQDGFAILTGATYEGQAIEGMDEITIVPPE